MKRNELIVAIGLAAFLLFAGFMCHRSWTHAMQALRSIDDAGCNSCQCHEGPYGCRCSTDATCGCRQGWSRTAKGHLIPSRPPKNPTWYPSAGCACLVCRCGIDGPDCQCQEGEARHEGGKWTAAGFTIEIPMRAEN